jgi:uncharacterized protein
LRELSSAAWFHIDDTGPHPSQDRARIGGMLELRPTCENCNRALPPESIEAMICSFECTFCRTCVTDVLRNVCRNCGGGFSARPIRPRNNWKGDNYLGKFPASTGVRHRPVDLDDHRAFAARMVAIAPEDR